jgi:exopolysaccharide biosynthesis polyprenyl glycosylphosphotransferase
MDETALVGGPAHYEGRIPPSARRRSVTEDRGPVEAHPSTRRRASEGLTFVVADVVAAGLALLLTLSWAGLEPPVAVLVSLPALVAMTKAARLYDRDSVVLRRTTLDELPRLAQLDGLFAFVVWLLIGAELSAPQALALWVGTFGLTLLGRAATRATSKRLGAVERCLVIGSSTAVESVTARLAASGAKALVVATIELRPEVTEVDVGLFQQLVERERIDRVLIAPPAGDLPELLVVVRVAISIGLRVSVLPRLLEIVGTGVELDELDGLTILGVRPVRLSRPARLLKRSFDLTGATIGLVLTAPLMLAIAVAIRLDSPGPILFRQVRVGRDGRPFRILKFRSMVRDAEAIKPAVTHLNAVEVLFKIAADPRVTRVGAVLRRWRLDELPQLLNVWRGEMSLVGPRPLIAGEDAHITGLDRARLRLAPGMTGHWQVLGSTRVPMRDMVAIDCRYVANWSLWTDVKLLLRTIRLIASGAGV